jgi:hypothetical protein
MIEDFDRLFELLEKADWGAECKCSVTTVAYLKLAIAEVHSLAGRAETWEDRQRFLRGARISESKMRTADSFADAAHFIWAFWRGFEGGWFDHTLPGKSSNAYKIGRKVATNGSPA